MIGVFTYRVDPPLGKAWIGDALRGWWLGWVRTVSGEWAHRLHDSGGRKPYTLRVLTPEFIRVTTLSRELTVWGVAELKMPPPLRTRKGDYELTLADQNTILPESLLRKAEESAPTVLHFQTPTLFRQGGYDLPLPIPGLILHSLVEAWDQWGGVRLPLQVRTIPLRLTRHRIRTIVIPSAKKGVRVGFVGEVGIGLPSLPEEARILTQTLLWHAEYSGIGVGSTAGMGGVQIGTHGAAPSVQVAPSGLG
jgi:CRISPR/Cas system endoribonuclease Cas6 (RAMP superfamily)